MTDWFQGTYAQVEGETSPEAMVVMTRDAEAFLRAGGVVSWDKWASLTPVSRAAWIDAGDRIATERAVIAGLACHDKQVALGLLDKLDGGASKVARVLAGAMDRALAKLGEGDGA